MVVILEDSYSVVLVKNLCPHSQAMKRSQCLNKHHLFVGFNNIFYMLIGHVLQSHFEQAIVTNPELKQQTRARKCLLHVMMYFNLLKVSTGLYFTIILFQQQVTSSCDACRQEQYALRVSGS